MTLDFMRDEIWQHIGEPSDLDPDSDTQYNSGPLLDFVVNEGIRQVATFSDPSTGRSVRLPEFLGEMNFQSYYTSGTLDNDSASETIVLPSGSDTTDDAYNGWVVTVGGESKYIVDYTGGSLTGTISGAWSSTPESGDSYELSKNFQLLVASGDALETYHIVLPSSGAYHQGNFLIPLKIIDIENTRDLAKASKVDAFAGVLTQTGTPTEWVWLSNKIMFNYVPDEQLWYHMEYYRLPKTLSNGTDEPDIPEFLQYGIVLWGRWWGFARGQAAPEAYSAKRDFIDFMRQRLNLYAVEYLREEDYGVLRIE